MPRSAAGRRLAAWPRMSADGPGVLPARNRAATDERGCARRARAEEAGTGPPVRCTGPHACCAARSAHLSTSGWPGASGRLANAGRGRLDRSRPAGVSAPSARRQRTADAVRPGLPDPCASPGPLPSAVGNARVRRTRERPRRAVLQDPPRPHRRHRLHPRRAEHRVRRRQERASRRRSGRGCHSHPRLGRSSGPVAPKPFKTAAGRPGRRAHGPRPCAPGVAPRPARPRARPRHGDAVPRHARRAQGPALAQSRARPLLAAAGARAHDCAPGRRQGQRRAAGDARRGAEPLPGRTWTARAPAAGRGHAGGTCRTGDGAGNRITILQVPLGQPGATPAQRLADIVAETREVKAEVPLDQPRRAVHVLDRRARRRERHRVAEPGRPADAG